MGNLQQCCGPPQQPVLDGGEGLVFQPTNRVQLAASELFSVPGLATAYHTSIVVNGEEFFFSDSGIFSDRVLTSHQGKPSELRDLGCSSRTGAQLLHAMQPHFSPGSYDLIRKNCNSFSDCALFFLLRKRLDRRFSALERFGQQASMELIQRVTKGMYEPNKAADSFSTSEVLAALEKLPETCDFQVTQTANKPALSIGGGVTIVGLKSAAELNGQGAQIVRYNAVNGRFEARLYFSGEVKAFRAENLRPAGELVLEPGDLVRIHGLSSEQGKRLEGREGEILRYLHDTSRYEVRIGEETKALRAENLEALCIGSSTNTLTTSEMGAL